MGAAAGVRSPQASTPAQGGKGGGTPMPAQGGKGGRPMPTQGGKGGGRPMPAQGGKAPIPMGGMLGGGYPQQPGMNPYGGYPQRDYGYGNQLPLQPFNNGVNDALSGSNYMPRSGSIPPQGGKTPLTPEQLDALGPYINNRPPPPGVTTTQAPVEKPYVDRYAGTIYAGTAGPGAPPPQQPAPVQQPVQAEPQPLNTAGVGLTPINTQVQQPAPRQFDPKMMYYMEMRQRQQMEEQRRQQEAMMRLPPRLRQRYMQQMNQGQQPSNLGLGGLGGLLGGFR
jgi:hypothetical protein